jgi:hypothetical protein
MTTQISADNIQAQTLENLGGAPTVTQVQVCDSNFTVLDDTAVGLSGGFIRILGTRFAPGCQVLIDQVLATSVTFVNSGELQVVVPALVAGTYIVYLVNSDGSVAIRVNGITFSSGPLWNTASSLPLQSINSAISIQLNATGDVPLNYSLQAGSSLPPGISLSSGGLLSGTITGATSDTNYNFVVEAIDAQLQESPRTFTLTVTTKEELYVPSETTLLLGLKFNDSSITKSGSYSVTVNQTLTYQTSGGVLNTGFATGWDISQGIQIDSFTTVSSTLNKTYIAWYKGTQTNTGGTYSPSVPIFSNTSSSVWWGFGVSNGKISISNAVLNNGTTNIATDEWFCLAWTVSSSGVCNGFVNGVKEITNIGVNTTYYGPVKIGAGYNYVGTAAPTALDAIQIFNGVLSDAQIASIYTQGII